MYPQRDGSVEFISCVPPNIFDVYDGCICEEGEECGINCCGEGERCINESSCCPEAQICENELFSTCCPDGQICVNGSCEEPCSEEAPVPCSLNGESWCCAEGNTCGTTTGQCCQDGVCCSDGQKAYWNGSSVGCCSTETHKIVKNYKNGVGEAGYACCEILQEKYNEHDLNENLPPDIVTSKNYTIVGAVSGVCCGGYQDFIELSKSYDQMTHHDYYVYSIRQNGGIYYCATDFTMYTTDYEDKERDIYEAKKYINNSTYCYKDYNGGGYCECSISDSGDPQSSSNKKYIDECFL